MICRCIVLPDNMDFDKTHFSPSQHATIGVFVSHAGHERVYICCTLVLGFKTT